MRDAKPRPFGPMVLCKCGCGRKRHQFDANGKERGFIWGHAAKLKWREYQEWRKKREDK